MHYYLFHLFFWSSEKFITSSQIWVASDCRGRACVLGKWYKSLCIYLLLKSEVFIQPVTAFDWMRAPSRVRFFSLISGCRFGFQSKDDREGSTIARGIHLHQWAPMASWRKDAGNKNERRYHPPCGVEKEPRNVPGDHSSLPGVFW